MKIAILSDIHGNHYALEKVLEAAVNSSVDELLVLGDFVGYYYHPDIVLNTLANWKYLAIRGNHENILEDLIEGTINSDENKLKYGNGHNCAIAKLSQSQKDFLKGLPETRTLKIDNTTIMMAHGSPWDNNFYLYPDCDIKLLERCDYEETDFILVGHSHYGFCRSNKFSTLINVGSVGQSRNQSGVAQWAIIDTVSKVFEIRSTPYNVSPLLAEIEVNDSENNYLKKVLTRNT